ncbi:MAG: histidine kinase, partial [Ferruginibacter sp.]
MRKHIISLCLFTLLAVFANAQSWIEDMVTARQMVDSLKQELKTAKGEKRIDCLNLLTDTYYWIWDENDKHLDTACLYADQAYELAKKSTYKKGLGYATLYKAHCFAGRTDNNINNNDVETNYVQAEKWAQQAIKIGEEIKDYRLTGDVYNMLKWMERWRGSAAKYKTNVEKAIYYYDKPATKKLTGLLDISKCDQCKGNEKLLGGLYQSYAQILGSERKDVTAIKESINKAIFYYSKIGNKWGLAVAYRSLGQVANQSINLETGTEYILKAVTLFGEADNPRGELEALNDLCGAYWNMGDFEKGLEYSKKSILTAERLVNLKGSADSIRLGQAYYWMGRFYSIAGDYETALSFMRKARRFYDADSRMIEGAWRVAMGSIHNLTGNYDSALYYLSPWLNKPGAGGKFVLGDLYVSLKQYDNALKVINDAIKSQETRNDQFVLGRYYIVAAKAYFGKNDYPSALTNARTALSLLGKVKSNTYLINDYQVLSDIFNKMGKYDSAFYYLKLYTESKDSLLKKQFYKRLNDYKKEAEDAKRIGQINLLQKNNLIKEQLLQEELLLKQQSDVQLTLLDKSNEIKDQQLLIKDQRLKEQTLLKDRNQSQLTLLDKENKLKDERLKQQAFIRNALLGGLLLFILLGIFVFRTLSLKRKNEKLAIKKEQAELQQKVTELEMQALRAQMNPHFIFNCLSSINRFIFKNDNKVASDYLTRF